jgi:hypothetical protein
MPLLFVGNSAEAPLYVTYSIKHKILYIIYYVNQKLFYSFDTYNIKPTTPMKTKKLFPLNLLVLLIVFLASCSESDNPTPSKQELLTEKTWKVSRITRDKEDVTYQPEMLSIRTMRARYNSNGTYTQTSPSYNRSGAWVLADNILTHNQGTSNEENMVVETLTRGTLRLSFILYFADGSADTFTLDLVHAE